MALPRKLKNMNLFNSGESYLGQVKEVVPPKLARKMEEWRGGGMDAPIKADMGREAISMEWTCGGLMKEVLSQEGVRQHNAVQLRFAGAYERDDTGEVDSVEIVVHGRHSEVDMGSASVGDDTDFKVVTEASYLKITVNGHVEREIDILNMIDKDRNGVDRLQAMREAIGA